MEDEFRVLLQGFTKLNLKEPPESTFLEIVGKSHLENVWSRILAFYFDPNKVHKMKDMLIKSLFDSIGKAKVLHSLGGYIVHPEFPTKKGNRIDIVIETSEFVIGIENKVNSSLDNDLEDYANTIKTLANGKEAYCIVLSKNKNIMHSGFENLTYENFINSIKRNIGNYHSHANTKYFIFFLDFIDNIEKNLNIINMINDPNAMRFFIENAQTIQKLIEKHNQINGELDRNLYLLQDKLSKDVELQTEFRKILSDENFILEICPVYRPENCLWVMIRFKDELPEILVSTIYYEGFKWYVESNAKSKYESIFGNVFGDSSYYLEGLDPWADMEEIKMKVVKIILSCAELVNRKGEEILKVR